MTARLATSAIAALALGASWLALATTTPATLELAPAPYTQATS